MNKNKVGVLMGGPSSERAISIKSGKAVYNALLDKGIKAVPVELEKGSISNGYKDIVKRRLLSSKIDIAFLALHGEFGEDGTIQEILEDIDIPYTGSKVDASRLGMDKIGSRKVFKAHNIPVPDYIIISSLDKTLNPNVYFKEFCSAPLVIKPSNGGSSIGLSIIDKDADFSCAVKKAFSFSDYVIVERYIKGREITVGILDDKALPIVEIVPKHRFFDFDAKYRKGLTEYKVPADIEKGVYADCQEKAVMAHRAVGAHFFSRVDMIINDADNSPIVLEINTIPGLTETSLLPKAGKAVGIDFGELIVKILGSV